ncbi:normocyte-binding protein 1, partial [Francisella tularensis subsp. holarctica]|nr:normocyte-binding protein 1 [Francisella tularensis subsp. holarctica]
ERTERLKILIDDVNIDTRGMGTTVDARIKIIIDSLKNISKIESNILSSAGSDAFLEKINDFVNKYKSNYSLFRRIRE